jgi:cytochrome P450
MTALAQPLPARVICRIVGLPESGWPIVRNAMLPISSYIADQTSVPWTSVSDACDGLTDLIQAALDGAAPRGTILGTWSARPPETARPTAPDNVLGAAQLLLTAGVVTTTAAIGNLFTCLARHPETWEQIASGVVSAANVVTESLRLRPPLHSTVRFAAADLTIGDTAIVKGARTQLMLAAANRDSAVFADPHAWNPGLARRPVHHTFGRGPHACIGAQLAFAELTCLLTRAVRRFTIAAMETPRDFQRTPFHQPTQVLVVFDPRDTGTGRTIHAAATNGGRRSSERNDGLR